jgi:hypothetical protein
MVLVLRATNDENDEIRSNNPEKQEILYAKRNLYNQLGRKIAVRGSWYGRIELF